MRLSWGPGSGSSGGSLQRSRRSDAALLLTAVLTMSLLVAGCNLQQEQTQHGYTVYNDSSGTYVVRMSYANGTGYALLAPPQTSVHEYGGSDPVKALVFDATCSKSLITLKVSGPWAEIYIDEAGRMSTSAPSGPRSTVYLPEISPGPAPASCN